jgi:hypothetical protein
MKSRARDGAARQPVTLDDEISQPLAAAAFVVQRIDQNVSIGQVNRHLIGLPRPTQSPSFSRSTRRSSSRIFRTQASDPSANSGWSSSFQIGSGSAGVHS